MAGGEPLPALFVVGGPPPAGVDAGGALVGFGAGAGLGAGAGFGLAVVAGAAGGRACGLGRGRASGRRGGAAGAAAAAWRATQQRADRGRLPLQRRAAGPGTPTAGPRPAATSWRWRSTSASAAALAAARLVPRLLQVGAPLGDLLAGRLGAIAGRPGVVGQAAGPGPPGPRPVRPAGPGPGSGSRRRSSTRAPRRPSPPGRTRRARSPARRTTRSRTPRWHRSSAAPAGQLDVRGLQVLAEGVAPLHREARRWPSPRRGPSGRRPSSRPASPACGSARLAVARDCS